MRSRKIVQVGLLALLICAVWASAPVRQASAHAVLVRSVPAANAELAQPPSQIDLWFSEPLEPGLSQARLLASDGREVPAGKEILDPADPMHTTLRVESLAPGIYTVSWRTLSEADGHVYSGSFPFTVLNPDGTRPVGGPAGASPTGPGELPSPLETLARWIGLVGSILLLGAPLFFTVVVQPHRNLDTGETGPFEVAARQIALTAVLIAVLAITLGHSLQMALQALRLGGLNQLPELLLGTRAGTLMLARVLIAATCAAVALRLLPSGNTYRRIGFLLSGIIAATAALLLASNDALDEAVLSFLALLIAGFGWAAALWPSGKNQPAAGGPKWAALFLLASAALLYTSIGSHASAGPGSVWAVLSDYVHLMAASAWVGGLLLLPILLWRTRRSAEVEQAGPLKLRLVQRFSFLASFSVFVLIMTGIFNSLVQLPDLPSLWNTAYGQVLVVKLGLLSLVLGVAFLNNRLVHGKAVLLNGSSSLPRLNRQVTIEAGLALLLMLSVAVLVQTTTPRSFRTATTGSSPEVPVNQVVKAGDLSMNVQILPNRVGYNRFYLNLFHEDCSPIGEVQRVELRFYYLEASLGQASTVLDPVSQTTFTTEGAYLSQAGEWNLSIYIQRRGMEDILAPFKIYVPSPVAAAPVSSPWQSPVPGIPPVIFFIVGLVMVGIVPLVWREPLEAVWPGLYSLLRRAAFLCLILGIVSGLVWLVLTGTASV